jgi:hypothetical protein
MAKLSPDVQTIFLEAQELQSAFWSKLSELESCLGNDIEVSGIEDLSTFSNVDEYVTAAKNRE